MRKQATTVRGVFVIIIILGVVLISNLGILRSGAQGALLDVPTPSPSPTATPLPPQFFPLVKNLHGSLENSVIITNGQGFDNCKPLSIEGMQTWWDHSPYSAVNIYLGGISALCPFDQLDYEWYTQVASQGWTYILTWAGPQAPHGCPADCKFRYPMSTDPATAYLEGKLEAFYAVEAATNLGFKDQLVIYYDVESYSGADEETKAAVAEFIRGWTEQLHELGHFAGAYGAACTSYIVDWAFNDPPPDDVWIAQWNKEWAYDPDATVYDTTCLDEKGQPPIFWADHQRIKQYTGPHNETWGGLTVKIDSDVLDGHVNALYGHPPQKNSLNSATSQPTQRVVLNSTPALRDIQMLTSSMGWVLRDDQLLITPDGGQTWQDISPGSGRQTEILDVYFINADNGWSANREIGENGTLSLAIYVTGNGGNTWRRVAINQFSPDETWEIGSASFEFVDGEVGWLALGLHSGNNFSFGRLLATGDGGYTWHERQLPLGEPVFFQDAQHGWTAGGPLDQVYITEDGGHSWQLQESNNLSMINPLSVQGGMLPRGTVSVDLLNNQIGWAIIQEGSCSGYKTRTGEALPPGEEQLKCTSSSRLMKTADGGSNWIELQLPGQ